MDKFFKYNIKKLDKKRSAAKLVPDSSLLFSLFIIIFSISNFPLVVFGQNDTITNDNQMKHSGPHNAVGHESHRVVQFVEPKDGILYNGSTIFKSSIPVDIIVYNDTSFVGDNINNPTIKTWKIDGKTFVPTTVMKNTTSGTIDFIGSGITSHIPYNDTYDVTYSIHVTSSSNTKQLIF
jgi:hypothetical protein